MWMVDKYDLSFGFDLSPLFLLEISNLSWIIAESNTHSQRQ